MDYSVELNKILNKHYSSFEDGGMGLYNLNLGIVDCQSLLSFDCDKGLVIQFCCPNQECNESFIYVLNYFAVGGTCDHNDISFDDLEEGEQKLIYIEVCKHLGLPYNTSNKKAVTFNDVLHIFGEKVVMSLAKELINDVMKDNTEFIKLICGNSDGIKTKICDKLSKKLVKGYAWVLTTNDGLENTKSPNWYATKCLCYNSMRSAALEKAKWNTKFSEDYEKKMEVLEADPIGTDYSNVAIGYNFLFKPNEITHESYSGKYTYKMVEVLGHCDSYNINNKYIIVNND